MSEFNKIENAKAELLTTIKGKKWTEAQSKAFKKLAKNIEVKGFRKGQAPANLVKQQLSENRVLLEAAEMLAQGELEEAIKEHNVELIDRPELKINKINTKTLELVFVCPIKPDVKIEDYQDLIYTVEEAKVDKEDVDKQLLTLRENKAEMALKEEGSAENGNTVVIDYVGSIDGKEFAGGSAENHELVLGSHSFIPGFEEGIIGMQSEESKDIKVTFPADYHAEELRNKEAIFKVTVHEIKTKVLPEINDEFISELNINDVKNIEQLKAYINENLLKQKQQENENKAREELLNKLNEKATIELPSVMVKQEIDSMINDYQRQWGYQMGNPNFKFDAKMRETFSKNMHDEASKKVRISLIIEELAKQKNISVSDEEISKEYEKLASAYNMKVDELKKYMPKSYIEIDLRDRKTIESFKK